MGERRADDGRRMSRSTPLSDRARRLLAIVLLAGLAALLLLLRPAPSTAKVAGGACSSAPAHVGHRAHACAGRNRAAHVHGLVRGRRSGHRDPIAKKRRVGHGSDHAAAIAGPVAGDEQGEAECEDGSEPERSGSAYACEDGSQPACPDGSQPQSSGDGSALVCVAQDTPAPSSPAEEEGDEEAEESEEEAGSEEGSEEELTSARVAIAS
jgi:hypothetical protein